MRAPMMSAAIVAAFAAGYLAAQAGREAKAQGAAPAPLAPQIISTADMKDEEISPLVPMTELRTKTLVATEWGTIGVQVGNIFKHKHDTAHEFQYIIEGTGTAWLGDQERPIKAGDLIVIPKGTAHAGTKPASGRFKAIAIKLPPQGPNDTTKVD